ncbi:MAG: FMN-binding negative transcriptional regulator [Chloroflexota bacterium]
MYQPGHGRFTVDDPAAELARLVETTPATLVTLGPDGLVASILPVLYDRGPDDGPLGTIRGHLARGNPQWRAFSGDVEALLIADGPDAYISPGWYETKRRTGRDVPTWNYVTVHARGPLVVHHDSAWLEDVVRRLSDRHEAGRAHPWSVDDAPRDYLESQLKAIAGVEIRLAALEAKRKLSQNRIAEDVAGVVAGLGAGTAEERAVAAEMGRETPRT